MARSDRRTHKSWCAVVLFIVILTGAGSGHSSTVAPADITQVVLGADVVVHATAIESTSHWNERHSLIVTDTQFRVYETLKGAPASSITVRVPGGQIGKLLVEVPGVPGFAPGAEAVLALARDARGAFCVAGGGTGRWDVETDVNNHVKIVRGVSLRPPDRDNRGRGPDKTTAAESPATLNALLQDLRERVRKPPVPGGR